MSQVMRIPLRIVFYKEDGEWLAHCLEFDLIGAGESRASALASLGEAIAIQVEASVEHNNPANLFAPAESRILQMFAAGKDVATGELSIKPIEIRTENLIIDQAECREYDGAGVVCA
jgi:predicted RNase H-like HicB family nuclease